MPTKFSTALPAMATITRPAKTSLIPAACIAGSKAATNHSDTKAAPRPATASMPMAIASGHPPCAVAALAAVLDAADHECQPEHQQGAGENRADDGGLHHVVKACLECEQDDEQLGQVPQRRLQDASGVGPEPVSERLH